MALPPQSAPFARRAQRLLRARKALAWALLLAAGVVLGLYLVRRHANQRATARNRLTIPQLGLTIQQSAHGVTIAKDSNGKPVFRVYAQRADKLRGSGRDELHDVRIVVYGSDGLHADQISGAEFAYDESTGEATAGGPVTIDAAVDTSMDTSMDRATNAVKQAPTPPHGGQGSPMHIVAQDLTLNVKTGIGTIAHGLQFSYLNAAGAAGQARVDSHAGELSLGGTVRVTWKRPAAADLLIRGDRAELRRLPSGGPDAAVLTLAGEATLQSGDTSASAGMFVFYWRADRTLRHMDALGQMHAGEATAGRRLTIAADAAHADFVSAGLHHTAVNHLALAGAVDIAETTSQQFTRLTAATAAFLFGPHRQLAELQAQGAGAAAARLQLDGAGRRQSVTAHELNFHFAPAATPETPRLTAVDALSSPSGGGSLERPRAERASPAASRSPPTSDQRERPSERWRATTGAAPVQIELTEPVRSGAPSGPIEAQAAQFHLALDARQQPTLGTASGDVRLRQTIAAPRPGTASLVRTSRSDVLVLHFAGAGAGARRAPGGAIGAGVAQLVRAVETGHVELRQADRRLQADAADYDVAAGRVVLSAQPRSAYTHGVVHGDDAGSTFTAPSVVWTQAPGGASQLLATGGISLSHAAAGNAAAARAQPPVVVTAQSLRWIQPPSASGGLTSSPQAPTLAATDGLVPQLTGTGVFTGGVRLVQVPNLLRADRVSVDGAERALTASGHVETVFLPAGPTMERASSAPPLPPSPVTIAADSLQYHQLAGQAIFQGAVQLHADGAELTAPQLQVGLSPQSQLTKALARGGVRITQPGRTLTAQQASFDFSTRRGQLSGGPPSIFDAEQGRMSGDPLTFSLSSDEIQVGSKSGARASGQTTIRSR